MSDITPERYERVLEELVDAQADTSLIVRARCAPHFKRVAHQRDADSRLTRAEGYEGGGCLAGIHYCRVTPEGGITACPGLPPVPIFRTRKTISGKRLSGKSGITHRPSPACATLD